jgi:hypothetical protein
MWFFCLVLAFSSLVFTAISFNIKYKLYFTMKHKKERGRQVSVHSSLAADNGPRPVVKVKKHFEAVLGGTCKNYHNDAARRPIIVNKLPNFVANDLEVQEEHLQIEQKILKSKQEDTKRKW